jgi:hypothetical protein
MIYLAVPYNHPSPAVRHNRFEEVNRYAAHVMQQGLAVFSPISHSHPIEEHFTEVKSWDFWQIQDLPILKICDSVHVLCLPGWRESVGVAGECDTARGLGIPILYINPEDYNVVTHPE